MIIIMIIKALITTINANVDHLSCVYDYTVFNNSLKNSTLFLGILKD